MMLRKTPLDRYHDRAAFDCGVAALNRFLRESARRQNERHLVRTTVFSLPDQPERVLAYYATVPCEVVAPAGTRPWKGHPHPLPFLRLAKLAVDKEEARKGYGAVALLAAIEGAVRVHQVTVIGGLIVDAKDDRAVAFYRHFDLTPLSRTSR